MTEAATPKKRTKRPHAARSARILSTGLSATAILGMTAAYGAAEKRAASIDDLAAPGPTTATPLAVPTLPAPGQAPGLAPLGSSSVTPPPVADPPATTAEAPSAVAAAGKSSPRAVAATVAPVATVAQVVPVESATPTQTMAPVAPVETAAPVQTVAPVAPVATAAPPVQLTVPAAPPQGRTSGSN